MPKIKELYAFIATDKDENDEGIIAAEIGDFFSCLVATTPEKAEELRIHAMNIARTQGIKIRLVKFSIREDLGEIKVVKRKGPFYIS